MCRVRIWRQNDFFKYFLGNFSYTHIIQRFPSAPRSSYTPWAGVERFGLIVLEFYQITIPPPLRAHTLGESLSRQRMAAPGMDDAKSMIFHPNLAFQINLLLQQKPQQGDRTDEPRSPGTTRWPMHGSHPRASSAAGRGRRLLPRRSRPAPSGSPGQGTAKEPTIWPRHARPMVPAAALAAR